MRNIYLVFVIAISLLLANSCSKDSTLIQKLDSSYKFITEKKSKGLTLNSKTQFFLVEDRNYLNMYKFIKHKKMNDDTIYQAIFVDNANFVEFPKYPAPSLNFSKKQSKHIIAVFQYLPSTGKKNFFYYSKNMQDSIAKSLEK